MQRISDCGVSSPNWYICNAIFIGSIAKGMCVERLLWARGPGLLP